MWLLLGLLLLQSLGICVSSAVYLGHLILGLNRSVSERGVHMSVSELHKGMLG